MSRVKKSFKNAWVALATNIALLMLAFISRKACIDFLGENITGLNSTFSDILGFLNLAEMGVLAAVAYSLYKPLYEGDQREINSIMSIFCYIYRIVGTIILFAGVILSFFLPKIYSDNGVDTDILLVGFYTLLIINLLSYFLNYKQNILVADQKNWVIVATTAFTNIAKISLQVVTLKFSGFTPHDQYFAFLALELIFAFVYSYMINRKVAKLYPNLVATFNHGREIRGEYGHIYRRIRQVFSHKFGDFVLNKSDAFVISIISAGFSSVTIFTNYTLIFSRLTRLFFSAFDNIGAGVGNLIAEGNRESVYSTYRQLNSIFYMIGGIIFIAGYHLTPPFIQIWLGEGEKFLLDSTLFIIILCNIYISVVRRINELFLNAHGRFNDVLAPWIEAILNLFISLYFGFKYGIIGVVCGTLVSTFIIGIGWKPSYLYYTSFPKKIVSYYLSMVKYIGITLFVSYIAYIYSSSEHFLAIDSYFSWFWNAVVLTALVSLLLLLLFYISDTPTRVIFNRIIKSLWAKVRSFV